ncbi:MAG: hypothetical protein WC755_08920 [Candidatus Woesearchaeota archaeon]|jgi:hypothetical protein
MKIDNPHQTGHEEIAYSAEMCERERILIMDSIKLLMSKTKKFSKEYSRAQSLINNKIQKEILTKSEIYSFTKRELIIILEAFYNLKKLIPSSIKELKNIRQLLKKNIKEILKTQNENR